MTTALRAGQNRDQVRLHSKYGPTAVVTGASSGIGHHSAAYLASAGFDLVLVARNDAALQLHASGLRQDFGVDVKVVSADLGTDSGIAAVVDATAGLDIGLLVAAAGFGTSGALIDNDVDVESSMIAVNCNAVLSLTYACARAMVSRGRGGIVLFSSIVASQGAPLAANYAATKAYVHTLGEGLRHELRPHGVDVLISAPGPVESGFGDRAAMQMGGEMRADVAARSTLRALGRQSVVHPGAMSKVIGWSLSITPRRVRIFMMHRIFSGFTAHQRAAAESGTPSSRT